MGRRHRSHKKFHHPKPKTIPYDRPVVSASEYQRMWFQHRGRSL